MNILVIKTLEINEYTYKQNAYFGCNFIKVNLIFTITYRQSFFFTLAIENDFFNIVKNNPQIYPKSNKKASLCMRLDTVRAEGGNRTPTSISSTDFESVASTSSTTSAKERRKLIKYDK